MADSTAGGQDDATARINGLMGLAGKRTQERDTALARVAELEKMLQAQEPAATPANSQPRVANDAEPEPAEVLWQSPDGRNTRVRLPDGTIAQYTDPTPIGTNPTAGRVYGDVPGRDDGSPEWARAQVAKALGTALPKTSWP